MELEPQVILSIEASKRRVMMHGIMVAVPVFLVLSVAVFLTIVLFNSGHWIVAAGCIFISVLTFVAYLVVLRDSFVKMTTPARRYNNDRYRRFRDSLDAVSIAAGIDHIDLVVLDRPTVNSLAFQKKGKPFIGITLDALESGMSPTEIEAMMSHEVGHILAGDALVPMDAWHLKTLPFLIVLLVFLLAAATLVTILSAHDSNYNVLAAIVSLIALFWAATVLEYSIRHLSRARRLDDVLADSIAVKLTANPEGMKKAIARAARSVELRGQDLPRNYCTKHFFVCPHYPKMFGAEGTLSVIGLGNMESEDEAQRESELVRERLTNLEAIEQGHWPAFASDLDRFQPKEGVSV